MTNSENSRKTCVLGHYKFRHVSKLLTWLGTDPGTNSGTKKCLLNCIPGDDELPPRLLVDAALATDRVAVKVWKSLTKSLQIPIRLCESLWLKVFQGRDGARSDWCCINVRGSTTYRGWQKPPNILTKEYLSFTLFYSRLSKSSRNTSSRTR